MPSVPDCQPSIATPTAGGEAGTAFPRIPFSVCFKLDMANESLPALEDGSQYSLKIAVFIT